MARIVLVHGAWADESAWGFVRNDLAKRANVVVVNLHLLGLDPHKLSYKYQGLAQRLIGPTDAPRVRHELLA